MPGQSTLLVATGLDYQSGEQLGLPATNIDTHSAETVTVQDYDPLSGLITLSEPLRAYHFGASTSLVSDEKPIDMRGEVLLLSSNVRITGSTGPDSMTLAYPRPHGCHVLVADFFEPDFTLRVGSIDFDNVAIQGCSQEKTSFAGLKFHFAIRGTKNVTNSALSQGLGMGVIIDSSQNINFEGNVVHDFLLHGISAKASQSFTINQNVVSWIRPVNEPFPAFMAWPSANGGMAFSTCSSYSVTNNIVASTWHSGFSIEAYRCGSTQPHTGNIAHSISGYGVIVQGSGSEACSEFSHFGGYKNRIATAHMGGGTMSALNKLHDIVSIDSSDGIMAFGAEDGRVEVSNSKLIGNHDMPNLDCPTSERCSACLPRRGLWIPVFGEHETAISPAPFKLPKMFTAGGSWEGSSLFSGLEFIGWDRASNDCGMSQAAITTNHGQPDFHPLATFRNTRFINTDRSGMFAFDSPPQGWANLSDCWDFTCTGLYNVLTSFAGTRFSGIPSVFGIRSDFRVTSDNLES